MIYVAFGSWWANCSGGQIFSVLHYDLCSIWKPVGKLFSGANCSGGQLSKRAFVLGVYLQGINCQGASIPGAYCQGAFIRVAFVGGLLT